MRLCNFVTTLASVGTSRYEALPGCWCRSCYWSGSSPGCWSGRWAVSLEAAQSEPEDPAGEPEARVREIVRVTRTREVLWSERTELNTKPGTRPQKPLTRLETATRRNAASRQKPRSTLDWLEVHHQRFYLSNWTEQPRDHQLKDKQQNKKTITKNLRQQSETPRHTWHINFLETLESVTSDLLCLDVDLLLGLQFDQVSDGSQLAQSRRPRVRALRLGGPWSAAGRGTRGPFLLQTEGLDVRDVRRPDLLRVCRGGATQKRRQQQLRLTTGWDHCVCCRCDRAAFPLVDGS